MSICVVVGEETAWTGHTEESCWPGLEAVDIRLVLPDSPLVTWPLLTSGRGGVSPSSASGSSASCLETAALWKVLEEAPGEGNCWEPQRNKVLILGSGSWPRSRR